MTRRDLVYTAIDVGLLGAIVVGIMHAHRVVGGSALPAIKTDTADTSVVAQQFANSPHRLAWSGPGTGA